MVVENICVKSVVTGGMSGMRSRAQPLRRDLERVLEAGGEVVLDFEGVDATQSFIDELIGVVVLEQGSQVLKNVTFKNCNDNVRGIVRFVVSDRNHQYSESH